MNMNSIYSLIAIMMVLKYVKKKKKVLRSDDLLCTKRPEISPTRVSLRGQPRSAPKVSSPVRSSCLLFRFWAWSSQTDQGWPLLPSLADETVISCITDKVQEPKALVLGMETRGSLAVAQSAFLFISFFFRSFKLENIWSVDKLVHRDSRIAGLQINLTLDRSISTISFPSPGLFPRSSTIFFLKVVVTRCAWIVSQIINANRTPWQVEPSWRDHPCLPSHAIEDAGDLSLVEVNARIASSNLLPATRLSLSVSATIFYGFLDIGFGHSGNPVLRGISRIG